MMKSPGMKKLFRKVRRCFISGLLIWIPIWITVVILKFLIDILEKTIVLLPQSYQIPGLGVILTLIIIFSTGLLATNLFGNQLFELWDSFIDHIPFVRSIHAGVKDMLKMLMQPEGDSFIKVFLVEFPRHGMWTLAFQTGDGSTKLQSSLNNDSLISLYVPTTPNITSGFMVVIPKNEAIELDMTIEQALKFVISLGVVVPEDKKTNNINPPNPAR